MSTILYYSNFCEHSRKLLQTLSKSDIKKDIHFICIDKRVKDNNKTFIVLENGNKILMPENISRVPALLLLTQGYNVLYGDAILQHFRPTQEKMVKQATQNNMEPMAFSFGGGGGFGDVISDQYSFLDMDAESLKATGNGGMRQMHNYVDLNMSNQMGMQCPTDDFDYKKSNKISEELTVEKLQQQRDQELKKITGNRQPMGI
jgi:hypothetical protein